MDILILSNVRLFGECLEQCLRADADISVLAVVSDVPALRVSLERLTVDLVLMDITQGFDADEVRDLVRDYPGLILLALGLPEQEAAVIQCGSAGFAGYVPRHASIDMLRRQMREASTGRLSCPDHIVAGLMRALYAKASNETAFAQPAVERVEPKLSTRESGVAQLVGQGYSNKEIARELNISLATVKHHVHSILEKLQVVRRSQVAAVGDGMGPTAAKRMGRAGQRRS